MNIQEVQKIVKRYIEEWNNDSTKSPLHVILSEPGNQIQIPGITSDVIFGKANEPRAGMHLLIRANIIVLNQIMVPKSLLTTFFHEYGHAVYKELHLENWNEIDSEAAAIKFSLEALAEEGFHDLARREVKAVQQMSINEPYKSAVKTISNDPNWLRYSK